MTKVFVLVLVLSSGHEYTIEPKLMTHEQCLHRLMAELYYAGPVNPGDHYICKQKGN